MTAATFLLIMIAFAFMVVVMVMVATASAAMSMAVASAFIAAIILCNNPELVLIAIVLIILRVLILYDVLVDHIPDLLAGELLILSDELFYDLIIAREISCRLKSFPCLIELTICEI